MADALKTWLRTRLGAIMDLTPETFGRYTRDGTILAQILHSYDIISSNQLSTIRSTRDPALSRVNLRSLGIWLKLINVTMSEKCIDDISKDKGAASLQLFYKVYLSLEGKDRLHFIALQKEQKYIHSRFNVCKVSDDLASLPSEHLLSAPLVEAADTVLWYRNKFRAITKACRRERERFEALMEYPVIQPIEHFVPEEELPDKKQKESEILDEFTRKHLVCKTTKKYQECCPSKRILDVSCIEDPTAAAEYIDFLKKRSKKMDKCHELKLKTQTMMMVEAWERLLRKQDRSFDEALGRRVLNQSRYEKQMLRKLCEVRDLRNRIVETRRIVDTMLLKARDNDLQFKQYRHEETIKEERKDVKMEICRMRELHQRIHEEKMRRMKEKHQDICLESMNDLVDIAVKIADYRQANGNHIPNSIWNEWRMLFLKSQPIFEHIDYFDDVEEAENIEEIENEIEMKMNEDEEKNGAKGNRITNEEEIEIGRALKVEENQKLVQLERQQSLTDADFESYRDLASPWDQFVPKREKEVEEVCRLGCIVLGYIVHRLLKILYPYSAKIMDCPMPRVKAAAIILGVTNATLHRQLQELLKNTGIRLLTMEDAINHCLESYKREMVDVEYIDLNIISTTAKDIKRLEAKSKNDSRERHPKKIERSAKPTPFHQNVAEEKQTQTPRQIPYDDMDPILSDTAYIGKWTYEFLTLGQPISNELNTKILIEYLKGIGDVEGWALINYPNTYEQMAMLEEALTGREIPPDPVKLTDVNVEDIDPPSVRIVFKDDVDTFATSRQSRLLPNPISKAKDYTFSTFMTIYIKAMPKSEAMGNQEQTCIPLPDNATSMDEFYANQDIAYGFFYKVLDLPILEQLAKLITDHFYGKKLPLKLSEKNLQADHDKQKFLIDSKTAVIKRLIPKSKWKASEYEEKKDIEAENNLQLGTETQLANDYAKPGESNWQWLNFFQPTALLEILATLWESVEQAYIENLKETLSLRRMHISAIIPYKTLVFRNLMRFIDRPDKRQILLQDFHQAFNEINEDLRGDLDMKYELHCRVDDFRKELWELCDARRYEAEEERKRTLCNQWILIEAIILVNVYIGILQTEVDRFVDTMQLLQDYYTSMSQKPLQESRFSKIVLGNIVLEDVLQEILGEDKEQTAKIEAIKKTSARIINKDQFKTEIETLLIDVSKSFDPDQNIIYNIIEDNVRQVRNTVDSISSLMLEMLKKEEKAVILKTEIKNKGDTLADSTFTKLTSRNRDLVEEWRYAVLFEIHRIHQRLDVLNAAAQSDVTFFLDTIRQTFHRIHHHIVERYKRELESIDEMANVFCFAIEEERPIQQELLLDGDQFVVRSNIVSKDHEQFNVPIRDAPSPLRFRMVQLGRLIDIFQRVAPHGIVSERVLVYILQDLVSCGKEDCYPPFVPCAWRQLRPPDIEILVERLFGFTEYIEWREFVLYAMDLPVPSHQDILKARTAFKMYDRESKEVVTCEQFHSIPLWFLEISTLYKNLLDEKLGHSNFNTLENLMLRDEAQLSEHFSSLGNNFIENEDDSSAILRLILAKKLLCRMYLVNRDSVHYTAMLLAFCKNENPSVGLGKAFSLAMGARVCTDTVEGEKYVEELAEQEHRVKRLKLSRDYLREEANEIIREIVNYIINKTTETVVSLEKSSDHDSSSKRQVMIQQLNGQGKVDPAEFLLPEVIAEHLDIENPSTITDEYEYIGDETLKDQTQQERVIFWLPRDVCLTVLSTCLPWLASQEDLFHTTLSLREGIARVYDELRDEELNDEKDLVLAHRLVNHSFICELLCASSKFISKNMADILRSILKDKNDQMT